MDHTGGAPFVACAIYQGSPAMFPFRHLTATGLLLAGLIAAPMIVRAETYNTCAGFIDTLPAVISTQGTWCLRHDLSTGITSGNVITINTNNVTIDCNDFKLGGLAAGAGTSTNGITAENHLNATVRHCNIRGFFRGGYFSGSSGGGHVVEDNRFDGNTRIGLRVDGDGSVVRHNQVTDTGGSTALVGNVFGIHTTYAVDVLDNTVSGVLPIANGSGDGTAYGIRTVSNSGGSISGNRVRGLVKLGDGVALGIFNETSDRISLDGNRVVGDTSAGSIGLRCENNNGRAKDNTVNGFATGIVNCSYGGSDGNVVVP